MAPLQIPCPWPRHDPDESEIIAERLHGLQGWTDFAGILSFAGVVSRREDARS